MKKWNLSNKYVGWGITAFIVLSAVLGVYYLMFHGSILIANVKRVFNILMPIMFGLVIAYLLAPVMDYFEIRLMIPLCEKLRIRKGRRRDGFVRIFCIIITLTLFFTLLYALFRMIISQIVPSVTAIINNYDVYVDNFTKWLNKILEDNPTLRDNTMNLVNKYSEEIDNWINVTVLPKMSDILKVVSLSVLGIIKVAWNLIIGIIISVYVMVNKEKFSGQFKKIIYATNDLNSANIIINNVRFTHKTFGGFIGGKVLDSIVIGLLCFIGITIMQTPYAALISVIIGVTNVIPFFGPYLGAIPSAFLIFIVDPMHPLNVVYFAIFILILQQFDGNILGPYILGDSTGLSGFWVIFSITFFGGLWGVLGMIVGVPLFAVIYAAIKSIIEVKLKKKSLPTNSDLYTYVCAIDEKGMHTYTPERKQNSKVKTVYQFGQNFITDSTEQISGDYMTKTTTAPVNGGKTKKNQVKPKKQADKSTGETAEKRQEA